MHSSQNAPLYNRWRMDCPAHYPSTRRENNVPEFLHFAGRPGRDNTGVVAPLRWKAGMTMTGHVRSTGRKDGRDDGAVGFDGGLVCI